MTLPIDQIIDSVLRREGGYIDHAADRGGPTKYGITAGTLGEWRGWNRPATRREVKALDLETARAIYRKKYVAPFESLPEPLRSLMADWTVTSGSDDPVSALQAALQRRGIYTGRIDGVIGPKTRAAVVADPDQRRTYLDVLAARIRFYVRLALADKKVVAFRHAQPDTDLENLAGWTNRAVEFLLQLGG